MSISKFVTILISLVTITIISCGNESKTPDTEFAYLGFLFEEENVKVFIQGYTNPGISIKVNSQKPNRIDPNGKISELIFEKVGNESATVNITTSEVQRSILIKNPLIAYDQRPIDAPFEMKVNETIYVPDAASTVSILSISEDSRCPNPFDNSDSSSDPGSCIHKPKTLVHMKVFTPGFKSFDQRFYKEQISDYKFSHGGFHFNISKIKPEIITLNRVIPVEDYLIVIEVQKPIIN